MAERKVHLRAAVLDYLLKHGVASASLRPMAAALGTSARILMFHFKSKEALLQEAMEELQSQLRTSFAAMVDPGPRRVSPLKRFWLWAARPQNTSRLRLLYEVQIIAIQNPAKYGRYLAESSANWLAISLEAMSEPLRKGPMARLCIAVFDGLMLEYLSTGNLRATTQALDHFIALLQQQLQPSPGAVPPARRKRGAGGGRKRSR